MGHQTKKSNQNLQMSVEYTYTTHPESNNQPVEITSGEYRGMVFDVGRVSFYEKDDQHHIKFDYNVLVGEDPHTEEFNTLIGDIVVDILEREFKDGTPGTLVSNNDYRTIDPDKPNKE